MKILSIFVNDELALEHDCDGELSTEQLGFLDRMDKDMDRGIKIQGQLISQPDPTQRGQFVTLNLIRSLKQENYAAMSVSCAYLCQRLPNVYEVHVRDQAGGHEVEFISAN